MSNIKLKTADLKVALDKVSKGMGHGKILPITDYLLLSVDEGVLKVTATDLINWVIYTREVEANAFEAIVKGDQLIKLISKTTVPEVTLKFDKKGNLEVKGNGQYVLDVLDEEFPDFDMNIDEKAKPEKIKVGLLKESLKIGKGSVAKDMVMPCMMGYKIGKGFSAADVTKLCYIDTSFLKKEILITQDFANLIELIDSETAQVDICDGNILITSDNLTIYGPEMEGLEEYPDLGEYVKKKFDAEVSVNLKNFKAALDRLDVFKDTLSVNGIKMIFKKNFITLESLKGTNKENINYSKKIKLKADFEINMNLDTMIQVLAGMADEIIHVYYGDPDCMKFGTDKVSHFVSALEEDDDE